MAAPRTFEELLALADGGDAKAQYNVGLCYMKGNGVEVDKKNFLKVLPTYNLRRAKI